MTGGSEVSVQNSRMYFKDINQFWASRILLEWRFWQCEVEKNESVDRITKKDPKSGLPGPWACRLVSGRQSVLMHKAVRDSLRVLLLIGVSILVTLLREGVLPVNGFQSGIPVNHVVWSEPPCHCKHTFQLQVRPIKLGK